MTKGPALISHEAMLDHDPGLGFPERPDRLRAILDRLRGRDQQASGALETIQATPALEEQIRRVHSPAHIDFVESLRGRSFEIDWDTIVSPGTVDAAYLGVGAACQAVDVVLDGTASSSFALVRPPGHHAERARAMGFCIFNNISIAAEHAIAGHGIKRAMIFDWDVHHGNGTQHHFERRPDVLFISAHQHPLYPGTGSIHERGRGDGAHRTINIPLPAGQEDGEYAAVIDEIIAPAARWFQPELILISAGFDAHECDPLGGMRITSRGFGMMCAQMRELARDHCDGRIALMLEGGYDIEGLTSSVDACIDALCGALPSTPGGAPSAEARCVIDALRAAHPLIFESE